MTIFARFPLILILLAATTLSCSGKLDPGAGGSKENPSDGDSGGGIGNEGDGGDTIPPEITMINLKGGDYVPGGTVYKIYFSVLDTVIGFNESKIEYKRDGDAEWKLIADKVPTVSEVEASVDWRVCPQADLPSCDGHVDGDGYRIRITTIGKSNSTDTEVSPSTFVIDSGAPTLADGGLALKSGSPAHGFLQLVLTGAEDSATPITDVCVKDEDSTPEPTNACWTSIEAYGSTKALQPSPITITRYLGFFSGTYDFYVWARDRAGNMTTMTSSAAKDKISHVYASPSFSATNGYWNDTASDFTFRTDVSGEATLTEYSGSPAGNLTTFADPGSFVMTSKGEAYVNDAALGIVKIDLVNQTRAVILPLGPSVVEGTTGPAATARVKNPLQIAVDEDDWIWIRDEDRIGRINSDGDFNVIIGGGANENDQVVDPRSVKITYHANMKWYGTFAVLPNKQVVFNSEDPHAKLNPGSGSRFRLRVYLGNDGGRVDSIFFSGDFDGGSRSVDDLYPYGGFGFTYDLTRKYIKDIVGRFCVEAAGNCAETLMLKFSPKGLSPELIATHSLWSNLVLKGSIDSIYALNARTGLVSKLNMTTKSWGKVLGGTSRGTGYCNNGSASTSCNIRVVDAFFTKENRIFFMDETRIRSVEIDGRVQTLYEP